MLHWDRMSILNVQLAIHAEIQLFQLRVCQFWVPNECWWFLCANIKWTSNLLIKLEALLNSSLNWRHSHLICEDGKEGLIWCCYTAIKRAQLLKNMRGGMPAAGQLPNFDMGPSLCGRPCITIGGWLCCSLIVHKCSRRNRADCQTEYAELFLYMLTPGTNLGLPGGRSEDAGLCCFTCVYSWENTPGGRSVEDRQLLCFAFPCGTTARCLSVHLGAFTK